MNYSLMGRMRLPFIDSDLLYRGTLSGRFDEICFVPLIISYRPASCFINRDLFLCRLCGVSKHKLVVCQNTFCMLLITKSQHRSSPRAWWINELGSWIT
jgi:hypothetical protein